MAAKEIEIIFRGERIRIDANGWIHSRFTQHKPGPQAKVHNVQNLCIGVAEHSIVGKEKRTDDGIPNRFYDVRQNPDGTFIEAASCTNILRLYDTMLAGWATHIQMYSLLASTWTSGSKNANIRFIPFETEGGYPITREPLNGIQQQSMLGLLLAIEIWIAALQEVDTFRLDPATNLFQHKKLVSIYGGKATACASDRYDVVHAQLASARNAVIVLKNGLEDNDIMALLNEEQQKKMLSLLFAGTEFRDFTLDQQVKQAIYVIDTYGGKQQSALDRATSAVLLSVDADKRLKVLEAGAGIETDEEFEARVRAALSSIIDDTVGD